MIHHETLNTYNRAALDFSTYFAGVGARTELIEKGLELAGHPDSANAIEVGCGDGRDAAEIIPRVGCYEGFDPSEGLLSIARTRLPDARFVQADAVGYVYPEKDIDVVYAFASFLHLNRHDFSKACQKASAVLRVGGILLMTLKESAAYQEEMVSDEFGKRLFYYYDEPTVRQLAGDTLTCNFVEREQIKSTAWLYVGFQKSEPDSLETRA